MVKSQLSHDDDINAYKIIIISFKFALEGRCIQTCTTSTRVVYKRVKHKVVDQLLILVDVNRVFVAYTVLFSSDDNEFV